MRSCYSLIELFTLFHWKRTLDDSIQTRTKKLHDRPLAPPKEEQKMLNNEVNNDKKDTRRVLFSDKRRRLNSARVIYCVWSFLLPTDQFALSLPWQARSKRLRSVPPRQRWFAGNRTPVRFQCQMIRPAPVREKEAERRSERKLRFFSALSFGQLLIVGDL